MDQLQKPKDQTLYLNEFPNVVSKVKSLSKSQQKALVKDLISTDIELRRMIDYELSLYDISRNAGSSKNKDYISLEQKLTKDYNDLKEVTLKLAESASYVIREYDGVHRLSKSVADVYDILAGIHGGKPSE